jgi:hypothetical protein
MKKLSNKQTLKQAGYKFVKYTGNGRAIFLNEDNKPELFFANRGHASWGLRFNNTDWEFASSKVI